LLISSWRSPGNPGFPNWPRDLMNRTGVTWWPYPVA
jgi:hypothetical protein